MRKVLVLLAVLLLAGCSTIVAGQEQEITVSTNPSGANCSINRSGLTIGRADPTPAAVAVKKTKYDITIICDKDGFYQASYINRSGYAPEVFGNILIGGLVGWGIDSSTGSDNKYTPIVNITLVPDPKHT